MIYTQTQHELDCTKLLFDVLYNVSLTCIVPYALLDANKNNHKIYLWTAEIEN